MKASKHVWQQTGTGLFFSASIMASSSLEMSTKSGRREGSPELISLGIGMLCVYGYVIHGGNTPNRSGVALRNTPNRSGVALRIVNK